MKNYILILLALTISVSLFAGLYGCSSQASPNESEISAGAANELKADSFVYPTEGQTTAQQLPDFAQIKDASAGGSVYSPDDLDGMLNMIDSYQKDKKCDKTAIVTGKKLSSKSYYFKLEPGTLDFNGNALSVTDDLYYTLTRFEVETVAEGDVKPGDIITIVELYSFREDGKVYAYSIYACPPMVENETYLLFIGSTNGSAVLHNGKVENASLVFTTILIDDYSRSGRAHEATDVIKGYYYINRLAAEAIAKYVK